MAGTEDSTVDVTFFLLRHAQTEWNTQKRIQGQQDSPLTEEGRSQAERRGYVLSPFLLDAILTSPLGRAQSTARIINSILQLPIIVEARLQEQHFGDWTGMTFAELRSSPQSGLIEQESRGFHFCPPHGESRLSVADRVETALLEYNASQGKRVLVMTHESVIKSLLNRLLQQPFLPDQPVKLFKNHLHILERVNDCLQPSLLNHDLSENALR